MEHQLEDFNSTPINKSEEEEEDTFSTDFGSESQSCLICFQTVNGGGTEEGDGDDGNWWWKQFRWRPGEPPSLSRNVGWIFVLRKLLHFPVEQVAALLTSTGGVHPGAWCHLCRPCSGLVLEALNLHKQVGVLEAKIEMIGSGLKTELRRSLVLSGNTTTGQEGHHHGNHHEGRRCVQKIIRQFYAGGHDTGAAVIKTSSSLENRKTAEHASNSSNSNPQESCDSSDPNLDDDDEADGYFLNDEDSVGLSNDDDGDEDTGGDGDDDDDPLFTPSHEDADHDDDNDDGNSTLPPLRRSTRSRTQVSTNVPELSIKSRSGSRSSKAKSLEHPNKIRSKAQNQQKIRNTIHECDVCDVVCASLPEFKKHMKTHSSSSSNKQKMLEEFICPICQHSMPTRIGRIKHMRSNHPKTPLACDKCDFSTDTAATYYKHEDAHKIRDSLQPDPNESDSLRCKLCDDTVVAGSWKKMYRHVKRKHLPQIGVESFSCSMCDLVVFRKNELTRHCARIHGGTVTRDEDQKTTGESGTKWKCKLCPSEFHAEDNLSAHVTAKHSASTSSDKPELFQCKVCGLKVVHRRALLSHMSTEHQELYQFKCDSDSCGASFQTRMSLVRHKEEKHDDEPKDTEQVVVPSVPCSYCGKRFKSELCLERHLRGLCKGQATPAAKGNARKKKRGGHPNPTQYDCEKCNYKTTRKILFGRHIQDHLITENFDEAHDDVINGETKARCKLCGTVVTLSVRYQHLNQKHESAVGIQLYQCHICGKGFNNAISVAKHAKMHKRKAAKEAADAEATPKPREKAICEQCGESFRDHRRLSAHRSRFHSGNIERIAKSARTCKLCGVKFLHCRRLATHMREKHGELYRHKCDLCDAAFLSPFKLNIHKETKHFDRTWVCQHCNKTYKMSVHKGAHVKDFCRANPHSKRYNKDGRVAAGESATQQPANERPAGSSLT